MRPRLPASVGLVGRIEYDSGVSVGKSTRSKAQAAVSEAQADVKRLEAQLGTDQARLKRAETGDSIMVNVTSIPLVKDSTEFLRQKSEASVADAQAKVDRTTSELISARNGLKWAQRGLSAVDSVTGAVSEMMEPPEQEFVVPTDETPNPEPTQTKED